MDGRYKKGEALGMENTRRRGIKDECNEKIRNILSQREKRSVTVYGKRGIIVWIIHFGRRGIGDDNFGRGNMEKGLIITAR